MDAKTRRKVMKRYGIPEPGPLVRSFLPGGRSQSVIYAVTLHDHPGVVKVGRTAKWKQRRTAYENWNLRPGDGIADERVFVLTEEFVDLPALEKHILATLPFPLRSGTEWFTADLDDVARVIDQILTACGLSYV